MNFCWNLSQQVFFILSLLVAATLYHAEATAAQLTLTWTDNSTNESGFKIERKAEVSNIYAQVATVELNVTSYTDSSLTAGTTYCYRVRAYNTAGDSRYSNEACGTARGPSLVSSVLPISRSVQVGNTATAFAIILNSGTAPALSCSISPVTSLQTTFAFQTTDCATNLSIGSLNTPVDILAGTPQCFVFSFTPNSPIGPTDVAMNFDCTNTNPAPIVAGVNTLLLSASSTPVPDVIALAATCLSDDSIPAVNIPGASGTGAFAVATVNVGAGESITAAADTGSASLPVNLSVCQTDPGTGACLAAPASSVTTVIGAGASPTFGIFVQGAGTTIPFDPATNRVFVSFKDASAVTRGATSVAARTHSPACAP